MNRKTSPALLALLVLCISSLAFAGNMMANKQIATEKSNTIMIRELPQDPRTSEIRIEVYVRNPQTKLDAFGLDVTFPKGAVELVRTEKGELTNNFFAVMGNQIGDNTVRIACVANPQLGGIPAASKGVIAVLIVKPGNAKFAGPTKFEVKKMVDDIKPFKQIFVKKTKIQ